MNIKLVFLGTSAAVPTKDRWLPSIALVRGGEIILFDCGEGTQLRFIQLGLSIMKIKAIFITHMHGDHIFGLPGLIQTMNMYGRETPLTIIGPGKIVDYIKSIIETTLYDPGFTIKMARAEEDKIVYETKEYIVKSFTVEHYGECYGYVFEEKPKPGKFNVEKALKLGIPRGPLWKVLQEGKPVKIGDRIIKPEEVLGPPRKGKKIVYTGDTKPLDRVKEVAKEADVLIHDSTFSMELREKAIEQGHSTAYDAARIALEANVKTLILTHFSSRYRDLSKLLEEAKSIFPNTIIAYDTMVFEVN